MRQVVQALASLKLTVTLMALAMVLIFVGTLAQTNLGVWHVVDTYFRSLIAWVDLQLLIPRQIAAIDASVPFPGGYLIGGLMIVNLLAAHAIRFRLGWRRVGIVMLHAGLIVLIAGEFVTGMFADEGLMSIREGESSNYVEDIREVELAIVDPSDPDADRVVAFPQALVEEAARRGTALSHPGMPFEITVDRWMANARLLRARGESPATQGVGLEAEPDELPGVRGVDGAQTDAPAAYVTLRRGGETLGTWLLYADLIESQRIEDGDDLYGIALRYRRTYKPYTLHLIEFRHDTFTGTQIARNFSSEIRLVDPERGTDREVLIWMNNPLRYAGATFYQASYMPDGSGTVLQVVRNPGAALPYIATGLVGVGMTIHFVMGLWGYLRRLANREKKAAEASGTVAPPRHPLRTALPWAAAVFGLLIAGSNLLRPMPSSEYDIRTFSTLPVSAGGRVKPMDSAARHVLMVAGGRQSVRTDEGTLSATEFLLDLMADPESIQDLPVVRVDHPDVLAMLGLRPEDGGRITLAKVEPHWATVAEQARRVIDIEPKRRDPFQRAVLSLYDRVSTVLAHSSMVAPYAIPPMGPEGDWQPFHDAFLQSEFIQVADNPHAPAPGTRVNPAVAWYLSMMTTYSEGDVAGFNRAVSGYEELLRRDMPGVLRRAGHEVLFNRASLFAGAIKVYVAAFLLVCAGMLLRMRTGEGAARWTAWAEGLRVSAVGLLWAGFLVHTLAIALRIYLQERPPVTNLYSSAVFVGWAAVLIGLFLERIHRIGLAALGAATVGFATLVVAHNLGSDGDTMQMMQAVLDSNFWLATHVVVITLGYSAAFLAGTLAAIYLLMGVFTRMLTRERSAMLSRMVYGVICFALLLSFVGTVLGGIWADQSWGRFWGWDPKENGAALIVLITAIILHARWGGFIRARGIMVLAVSINIVTAWSWFGTNMLGIGLHSYGFMDSAVFWLMAFVVSQLVIMSIGLVPPVAWRSNLAQPPADNRRPEKPGAGAVHQDPPQGSGPHE